jgi:hypothetical protein
MDGWTEGVVDEFIETMLPAPQRGSDEWITLLSRRMGRNESITLRLLPSVQDTQDSVSNLFTICLCIDRYRYGVPNF